MCDNDELSTAELCSKARTELSSVGLLNALLLTIAAAPCRESPPVTITNYFPLPVQRLICEIEVSFLEHSQYGLVKLKSSFDKLVEFIAAISIKVVDLVAVTVPKVQSWLLDKEREKRCSLVRLSDAKLAELKAGVAKAKDIRRQDVKALDQINGHSELEMKRPVKSAHEAMLKELKAKRQEQLDPELLLPSDNTASEEIETTSETDVQLRGWATLLLGHIRGNVTSLGSSRGSAHGFRRTFGDGAGIVNPKYQFRRHSSMI